MMQKKIYGALAVALTATMAVSACSGSKDGGSGNQNGPSKADNKGDAKSISVNAQDRSKLDQGGTMTFAIASLAVNWNPWNADGNQSEISEFMQATDPELYNISPDGVFSNNPDYLEKMPEVKEEGGKEVAVWTMNPKAKFNDGTPMDYKAFEATWNALKAPKDKSGFNNVTNTGYEDVEKVEKGATDNEVKVTFKKKFYPATELFDSLLHPKVGMDAKVFNEGFTGAQTHNEYRGGAFIFDKVDTTNKTVTLVPNPKWWGQKPMLDKLIFREMEDSATIPAFKNGEIDRVAARTKSRYQQVQGAPNLDIRRSTRLFTGVTTFNSKSEGLGDVNVRKALFQALDRAEFRKIRFDGLNWSEPDLGSNFYFSFQPEYEDNFPVEKQSAEDAKKTLEGAGYTMGADGFYAKNGKKLTVKYTSFGDDPTTSALAQLSKKQAKAAGIDMALDIRPSAAFADAMAKKDFGIVSMGWTPGSSTPLSGVCQLICSTSESNYAYVGTPELDARIKKLGEISDKAAQAKEINAIEKEWMKTTYGMMPMVNGPQIYAYNKNVANLGPNLFQGLNNHWENVGWMKGTKKG